MEYMNKSGLTNVIYREVVKESVNRGLPGRVYSTSWNVTYRGVKHQKFISFLN